MKKTIGYISVVIAALALLSGCSTTQPSGGDPAEESSKTDNIQFTGEQMYAAAYLGYEEMGDIKFYEDNYLDSDNLPVHYLSSGDYYLIIPRYPDMAVSIYKNDIETEDPTLLFEQKECVPFIIQCNVSDIFADATIRFEREGETVEFSPFISLMDGAVDIGERGLDITEAE